MTCYRSINKRTLFFSFWLEHSIRILKPPVDALQELLTKESKEYLEYAIVFLTDFLKVSIQTMRKMITFNLAQMACIFLRLI